MNTQKSSKDVRWEQRFQNFVNARQQFMLAVEAHRLEPRNLLYRMALIQGFEFTYELGWKTIKDYLFYNGVSAALPREVIKEGFAFGVIKDGQTWINMLEDRNLMSHSYDEATAVQAVDHILSHYVIALDHLYATFNAQLSK